MYKLSSFKYNNIIIIEMSLYKKVGHIHAF